MSCSLHTICVNLPEKCCSAVKSFGLLSKLASLMRANVMRRVRCTASKLYDVLLVFYLSPVDQASRFVFSRQRMAVTRHRMACLFLILSSLFETKIRKLDKSKSSFKVKRLTWQRNLFLLLSNHDTHLEPSYIPKMRLCTFQFHFLLSLSAPDRWLNYKYTNTI